MGFRWIAYIQKLIDVFKNLSSYERRSIVIETVD